MKTLLKLAIAFICFYPITASSDSTTNSEDFNDIQRVRIDFTTSTGYVRHLLLGFTPDDAATDGFDYGYDAANIENLPDDLNWMIDDERYVIQGVGSFDDMKVYPLGMFISNPGEISIDLDALENFDNEIDVYVYDSVLNTYTLINNSSFLSTIDYGEHINRFYITFSNTAMAEYLSIEEHSLPEINVYYDNFSETLAISSESSFIDTLSIFDINGRILYHLDKPNTHTKSAEYRTNYLSNGTLIIHVTSNQKTIIKKIII
ncbi:T9SS type A sorting domain-containing protein [Winogradskyella sp. 3972H.M.0a.05]|uniref:T9SS type A sorting domain-containing protein n=1 Tax=Winogradskyella sp. 3972H.M.0a.05 TaxID=2950277 RepID=UPI0033927087